MYANRVAPRNQKMIIAVTVSTLLLVGCHATPWWIGLNGANLPADYRYTNKATTTLLAQQLAKLEEWCYRVANGEDPGPRPIMTATTNPGEKLEDWPITVSSQNAQTIATMARACRDQVVSENLTFINAMWGIFRRDYFARTGSTDVWFESSTVGLGAFAAISPVGTAHVLAATAATLSGMGTSIQKNLEGGQLAYVLLAQMDADREQIGAKIRQNLLLDYNKYPLSLAMYDVESYGAALSVPAALASISSTSGSKKRQAVEDVYGASAPTASSAPSIKVDLTKVSPALVAAAATAAKAASSAAASADKAALSARAAADAIASAVAAKP